MPLTIEGRSFKRIDSTGTYDYSWSEFGVLRGEDGLLYVGHDGGCSCNSFGDRQELMDFRPAENWHDVVKAVKAWRDGDNWLDGPEKKGADDLIERLSKSRPKKRDPKQYEALGDSWWD